MIHRLVASVSGPDALDRVRAALVGLYEQDPRFARVDDAGQAWIVWRLRAGDGGVRLVSSEVDLLDEASIGRDLGRVLGAEVRPAGAADRALADLAEGRMPDPADLGALDQDPEPPDIPDSDDVVVAIGSRSSAEGAGRLMRHRVSRGERFAIGARHGAHLRKWLDLKVHGGPVRSFRVRFTGAIVELLDLEGAEVRILPGRTAPVTWTIGVDRWDLSVPEVDLADGAELELHLALYTRTLGKGVGELRIETAGHTFDVGVDVEISPR